MFVNVFSGAPGIMARHSDKHVASTSFAIPSLGPPPAWPASIEMKCKRTQFLSVAIKITQPSVK